MLPNLERAQDMPSRLKGILHVGGEKPSWSWFSASLRRTCSWWRSQLLDVQSCALQGRRTSQHWSQRQELTVCFKKSRDTRAGVRDQEEWEREGGQWPNHRGSCQPWWRLTFILSEMRSLCQIWKEEMTWSVVYVLEGTVWPPHWGQKVWGDKEKQDTAEDVITAAWERERKMTERQGTVQVEKNSWIPTVFWRQNPLGLLTDWMWVEMRESKMTLRQKSWVTEGTTIDGEMVKTWVDQVWERRWGVCFLKLRRLLDIPGKKNI